MEENDFINRITAYSNMMYSNNEKLQLLTGYNGSGKTKVLNRIYDIYKNDYNNNNEILYFREDRVMNISKDDIQVIDALCVLSDTKKFSERINFAFNLNDPFSLEILKKNDRISCGYLQIANFLYTIYMVKHIQNKDIILIIDDIKMSLHFLIQEYLIRYFISDDHIKKVYISALYTSDDIDMLLKSSLINDNIEIYKLSKINL